MYVAPAVYMADFETTVTGEGKAQASTEVWASALVQINTPDRPADDEEVYIDNSIRSFFARVLFLTGSAHSIVYFHNLKFDGSFIIDFLLKAGYKLGLNAFHKWKKVKFLKKGEFIPTISNMGQWYTIEIKAKSGGRITFRDSLKLLPFSVDQIGKSFGTKHKKLSMEYVGVMKAGGVITTEQKEYITNDVLVVKEALEIFFADGLNKLTIGACCKDQYKKSIMSEDANKFFPKVSNHLLSLEYGEPNAERYIRHAYRGGWCYVKDGCENILYHNGCTADVNSLYPSMMLDNPYPVGMPVFWRGNFIPDKAKRENSLFIVRIRTRFYLKEGYLPTVQIKGSPYYKPTEWLKTSDVCYHGKYYRTLTTVGGQRKEMIPTLTMTSVDYYLFLEHYCVEDFEILDGCYFDSLDGSLLFGFYINNWAEVKKNSKGAKRQEAKLFLNNLYGKFASKIDNTTKAPYLDNAGVVHFDMIPDEDTAKEWYIPVGAFVTAYARRFTINHAQKNYKYFVYADTDSIHCTCNPDQLQDIKIHPTNFSCWALECQWDSAIFVRQKTYIEHVTVEDGKPVEPYYNIKCAGMDKRPKQLLRASLENTPIEPQSKEEEYFLSVPRSITDFKVGLTVPSKLMVHRIAGGIVLVPSNFQLH